MTNSMYYYQQKMQPSLLYSTTSSPDLYVERTGKNGKGQTSSENSLSVQISV